ATLSGEQPAGVTYGGYLPAQDVGDRLLASDVAFLSLSSERYAYAVPGKLYDYVAYGRPVLASLPQGSARRLIERENLGWVTECGDIGGLAQMLAWVTDPSQRQRAQARVMDARPRHAAREHFLSLSRRIQSL
ncbi:MAG: hypothetical protein VX528_00675, partial [Candidatus Latescibacterota bacterium]|nr:hypothetical protein [Candidatus Latescibacterota bacterium]